MSEINCQKLIGNVMANSEIQCFFILVVDNLAPYPFLQICGNESVQEK